MHTLPEFQTLEDKVTAAADRESDEYFTEISRESDELSTKHIAASPDPTDRGSLALWYRLSVSLTSDWCQVARLVIGTRPSTSKDFRRSSPQASMAAYLVNLSG